jgi:Right handed beta helix region
MLNRLLRTVLAFTLCTLLGTSLAHAQATRTWVSGVGDDANPCSRTAPCKTFAGAISKTAAAGEISVLDPGGYGQVTITKSIIINGEGTLAGIVASGAGIIINGANVVATLRNLSLVGVGAATAGVRLINGAALIGDRLAISGFDTAIETNSGSNATVINSTITQNDGFGVRAIGGSITVENSLLANNGVAVQADTGATVRLSNNGVYNNLTGFACGGGTLASAGNNRKANNVGGVVPVCTPNAPITLQ